MLKRIMLKAFREGVGRLIAFVSFITLPRKIKRSPEQQESINKQTQGISMYQFYACPFCIKTRRSVYRLNIPMEYRDAQERGGLHRETLEKEGGKIQVPCLRIDQGGQTTWLYESKAIVAYLNTRFDPEYQQATS